MMIYTNIQKYVNEEVTLFSGAICIETKILWTTQMFSKLANVLTI